MLDSQPHLATFWPHDLISLITPHSKTTDASVPWGEAVEVVVVVVGGEGGVRERKREESTWQALGEYDTREVH